MSDRNIYINNKVYDSGSVIIKFDGEVFEGITDFKYGQKRERTRATRQNRSRRLLGWTPGKVTPDDGSVTMWKASAIHLRTRMAAKAGNRSYGDYIFPVTIQCVEPGLLPVTDELHQCYIASDEASGGDNTDPLKEEIGIGIGFIKRGIAGAPGQFVTLYAPDRK
jgi:hypothetical protein